MLVYWVLYLYCSSRIVDYSICLRLKGWTLNAAVFCCDTMGCHKLLQHWDDIMYNFNYNIFRVKHVHISVCVTLSGACYHVGITRLSVCDCTYRLTQNTSLFGGGHASPWNPAFVKDALQQHIHTVIQSQLDPRHPVKPGLERQPQ